MKTRTAKNPFRHPLVLAATALLPLTACTVDGPLPPAPTASVRVAPDAATLQINESRQLSATLHTASGAPVSGPPITWSSSDTLVATVSATGLVTARVAGPATITATSEGKQGTASVTVAPATSTGPGPVESVDLNTASATLEEGDRLELTATPRDAQQNPINGLGIQWTTSDVEIAQVSPAGQVTGIRSGTATITATVHGKAASATVMVTASHAYDLIFYGLVGQSVGTYRLDIRSAEGQPVRLLPDAPGTAGIALPSPDGTRFAFTRAVDEEIGIYVVNRNGTGLRALITSTSGSIGEPTWSPDGTRIAFMATSSGSPSIWVVNVDGAPNPVNLTADLGATSQSSPTWSPQVPGGTSRIAFGHGPDGGVERRIWTMRPDGSDKRQITTGGWAEDTQPAWSPDGRTIAFRRIQFPAPVGISGDLWLVNATGGNERALMLTPLGGPQWSPAWSPDGKLIAFGSRHETLGISANSYIYTVWADGSNLVRRTFGDISSRNPAWIPR